MSDHTIHNDKTCLSGPHMQCLIPDAVRRAIEEAAPAVRWLENPVPYDPRPAMRFIYLSILKYLKIEFVPV